ncbi:MAG: site-specific tyrosine recombinase XerD [Acutalibacteraceae bacterium]|nr:site-specific tyrosine recombinase XerD [Acutalibacteraceae bacterium]
MTDFQKEFELYLTDTKGASKNTLESYARDISQFINYLLKNNIEDVTDVSVNTVKDYISFCEKSGKSHATITRIVASIRCYYNFLIEKNLVKINPTKTIKVSRAEKKMPEILTNSEIDKLLSQPNLNDSKGIRDKAMLELLYATGIRVSELINLNSDDVYFDVGVIHCSGTKNDRIIPVYSTAIEILKKYVENVRPLCVINDEENALFVNMNGQRLTRQGFWKIIKMYAKEAKINKDITPHTLRHSFAAHLLKNGAKLKDIQEMLGHSDISSTQIYAQLMKNQYSTVYNKYHPRANRG